MVPHSPGYGKGVLRRATIGIRLEARTIAGAAQAASIIPRKLRRVLSMCVPLTNTIWNAEGFSNLLVQTFRKCRHPTSSHAAAHLQLLSIEPTYVVNVGKIFRLPTQAPSRHIKVVLIVASM